MGRHRAELRIEAPGADDAPRVVPIHVRIGGDVPERVDFWVPPNEGASDFIEFQTPEGPAPGLTAGGFLSVTSNGLGSFRFLHTHRLVGRFTSAAAGNGANDGTLTVSGSAFAADNRVVPVTLHVTSEPIVRLSSERLGFATAVGVKPQAQGVVFANGGMGALTLGTVAVSTASGGDWLTATASGAGIAADVSVDGLAPGRYEGTVRVDSNAANSPHQVPVVLVVSTMSGPVASYRGLVEPATFDPTRPLAPGMLGSLFGEQLAVALGAAENVPLPRELSGAKIMIDGVEAPLVFVTYGQANLQVPYEVGQGERILEVIRDGQAGNRILVHMESRSPSIFTFDSACRAVRNESCQYGAIVNATQGNFPLPARFAVPGFNAGPARPGDVLSIFATGLGATNPAVPTGEAAPSSPLAAAVLTPRVSFSRTPLGAVTDPTFVGLAPGFVGLWQINVIVPGNMQTDPHTPIRLDYLDGGRRSKTVEIAVER